MRCLGWILIWGLLGCSAAGNEGRLGQQAGSGLDRDGDGWSDDDEALCGTDLYVPDSTPMDTDLDGECDALDVDDDDDGVLDEHDVFPTDATEHLDSDSDGTGDTADLDDDDDGVLDIDDALPFDAGETLDSDDDGLGDNADPDDDNDGVLDDEDVFPTDPTETTDNDDDGIGDNADLDDDNDGWSDVKEVECRTGWLDSDSVPWDPDGDGDCLPWQGPPASDAWYGIVDSELFPWRIEPPQHSASGRGLLDPNTSPTYSSQLGVDHQGRPVAAWVAKRRPWSGFGESSCQIVTKRLEDGQWIHLNGAPITAVWQEGCPETQGFYVGRHLGDLVLGWNRRGHGSDQGYLAILRGDTWEPMSPEVPDGAAVIHVGEFSDGRLAAVLNGPTRNEGSRIFVAAGEEWQPLSEAAHIDHVAFGPSGAWVTIGSSLHWESQTTQVRTATNTGPYTSIPFLTIARSPRALPPHPMWDGSGDYHGDPSWTRYALSYDSMGRPVMVHSDARQGSFQLRAQRLDEDSWTDLGWVIEDLPADLDPRLWDRFAVALDTNGVGELILTSLGGDTDRPGEQNLKFHRFTQGGWQEAAPPLPLRAREITGRPKVVFTDGGISVLWSTWSAVNYVELADGDWRGIGTPPLGAGLGDPRLANRPPRVFLGPHGSIAITWLQDQFWGRAPTPGTVQYREAQPPYTHWTRQHEWTGSGHAIAVGFEGDRRSVTLRTETRTTGYTEIHSVYDGETWHDDQVVTEDATRPPTYYNAEPGERLRRRRHGDLWATLAPYNDEVDELKIESCEETCRALAWADGRGPVLVDSGYLWTIQVGPLGNRYVLWTDNVDRQFHLKRDVYVLRVTPDDTLEELDGSASPGGVSQTPGGSDDPKLTFDSHGQPILAWSDGSHGTGDVYLKHYHQGRWLEHWGSASDGGVSGSSEHVSPYSVVADDQRICVSWAAASFLGTAGVVRCTDLWPSNPTSDGGHQ